MESRCFFTVNDSLLPPCSVVISCDVLRVCKYVTIDISIFFYKLEVESEMRKILCKSTTKKSVCFSLFPALSDMTFSCI